MVEGTNLQKVKNLHILFCLHLNRRYILRARSHHPSINFRQRADKLRPLNKSPNRIQLNEIIASIFF